MLLVKGGLINGMEAMEEVDRLCHRRLMRRGVGRVEGV